MDEKWIYFHNMGRKFVWIKDGDEVGEIGRRVSVTANKVMLSVVCDWCDTH